MYIARASSLPPLLCLSVRPLQLLVKRQQVLVMRLREQASPPPPRYCLPSRGTPTTADVEDAIQRLIRAHEYVYGIGEGSVVAEEADDGDDGDCPPPLEPVDPIEPIVVPRIVSRL